MGVLKFPKLGALQLWGPITLCADLRLRWGLKQSCSPHWKLSKNMLQATWKQGNQGDSKLLVVRSQIANLTLGLFFCHNLGFGCPNESCEPTLNICIPRAFQWYKECFNPMGFDPCNHYMKIWESIGTPTPKVGVHLGMWRFIPSHSCTPRSMKCDPQAHSWLTPLQALALVTSPRLGLQEQSSA